MVVIGGVPHLVARVRSPRCDLTLVSDLLRLRLHGRRLGWEVELREADDRLRDLLAFIGFAADGTAVPDDGEGEGATDDEHDDPVLR